MTDSVRSESSRKQREAVAAEEGPTAVEIATDGESAIDPHDTLVLLFMCCHPGLTSPGRAAYDTGCEGTEKDNRELTDSEWKELRSRKV